MKAAEALRKAAKPGGSEALRSRDWSHRKPGEGRGGSGPPHPHGEGGGPGMLPKVAAATWWDDREPGEGEGRTQPPEEAPGVGGAIARRLKRGPGMRGCRRRPRGVV